MVKITTLFGLALVTCTSAIPTVMTDTAQTNTELVPPCMCGNTTGLHCGERASGKGTHKPISGTCNATSLFYCSPWAVKIGGIADAVQTPCWTNKCYQSTTLGADSCTAPINHENHVNYTKPARPIKPLKAERDEVVSEVNPSTDPCICNGWTGLFCGQRALNENSRFRVLVGNCSTEGLYYCSEWAARLDNKGLDRLADAVQNPCWTNVCYQASNYQGKDSCNPIKAEREELVPEATPVAAPAVTSSITPSVTPAVITDCACGTSTGHFCGERASGTHGHITGNCNATSLYYCSLWAAKTGGFADPVQTPCWTNQCHQAAKLGYDSCTPIKSDIVVREEFLPEAKPKSKPVTSSNCTCGSEKGWFCGNRTVTPGTKDDSKSLGGNCNPDSVYYCTEAGGKAKIYQSQCPAGHCLIQSVITGFDYCSTKDIAVTVREEAVLDAQSKSKDYCRCGSNKGLLCGIRTITPAYKDDPKSLSGKCNPTGVYYCTEDAASERGKAYVYQNKCSTGVCFIHPEGLGEDYCKGPDRVTIFAERETLVPEATPAPVSECTCGPHVGSFCGERTTADGLGGKLLTGNCTANELYYCSPWAARVTAAPLRRSSCAKGECFMEGVGEDYCNRTNSAFLEREDVVPAVATNPLPVCTCGKDSGFFCGDRATAATKKNEHKALTGNCTAGALYHCDDSNLTSPQMAKVWESPCSGSGKCYQSVENGYDSCHH